MKRSEFLKRSALGSLAAFLPLPALAEVVEEETTLEVLPAVETIDVRTLSATWTTTRVWFSEPYGGDVWSSARAMTEWTP